jgi:mono/diheme cytochrome c family protein
MLKSLLLLSAVVLLALSAVPGRGSMPPQAPDSQAKTKRIYTNDCAMCHGENGDGKSDLAKDMQLTMPDFTDPKTLEGKTDQDLFDIIRKGKDKMPPEDAGRAKDDEVKSLIAYIRGLSKPRAGAGN